MLTLLTIFEFLKKVFDIMKRIGLWLKTYWYFPVGVIVGVAAMVILGRSNPILNALKVSQESYKKQVKQMNEISEKEQKKREENQKKYDEALKQLERDYTVTSDSIDKEKEKKIKELVEDNTTDDLAKKIAKEFGLGQ